MHTVESPPVLVRKAVINLLFPFLVGWLFSAVIWVEHMHRASETIAVVAQHVKRASVPLGTDPPFGRLVAEVLKDWEPDKPDAGDLGYRKTLVRLLVDRFISTASPWRPAGFSTTPDTYFWELLRGRMARIAAMHFILLFVFPALFISAAIQAARVVSEPGKIRQFSDEIGYQRSWHTLRTLAQSFFFRRLSFAVLLGWGLVGLFSPAGIEASIVGEFASTQPTAGESSIPFFISGFKNAAPYAVGFAGYYLYCLITFLRRFQSRTLNNAMVFSLFNRGILVLILSAVVSGITSDNLSRAMIFSVGVFPSAGLQAIAKISQTTVDRLSQDQSLGFAAIPEIDIWREAALAEVGVGDTAELGKSADWRSLIEQVGINPRILLHAADRALLVCTLGMKNVSALEGIPLFTASEIVMYLRDPQAGAILHDQPLPTSATTEELTRRRVLLEKLLGIADLTPQLLLLERDANVAFVIQKKRMYGSL